MQRKKFEGQRKKFDAQNTKLLSSLVLFVLVEWQAGEIKVTAHVREIVPLGSEITFIYYAAAFMKNLSSSIWYLVGLVFSQ